MLDEAKVIRSVDRSECILELSGLKYYVTL